MIFETLPTLGIGASLSLATQPDPVTLSQQTGGPDFIEYAGLADAEQVFEQVARIKAVDVPVLYHPSYINFCGSYPNHERWLQATADHIAQVESAWFAQDCAYCFWDEAYGYSSQFGYFIPPIFNEASLQLAIQRVQEVQAKVPVPVAIEPPPLTFVIGQMSLFEFFGRLAEATDCAILLDIGHLISYQMASGESILPAIQQMPMERVIEVHIAGGKIKQADNGPVYIDAHENPILDEVWHCLTDLLPLMPNVKALCYECEGIDETTVMQTLARLRETVIQHSSSASLRQSAEQTS